MGRNRTAIIERATTYPQLDSLREEVEEWIKNKNNVVKLVAELRERVDELIFKK